jgi:hypothetical protein
MTEEMHALESEPVPHGVDLVDEAIHPPQPLVAGTIGSSTTELAIEHHPPAVREAPEGFEVVVGEAGAAVQTDQRCGVAATDNNVGNPPSLDFDVAFLRHRSSGKETMAS